MQVRRLGRPRVRISETADPAARNFSFAVRSGACGWHFGVVQRLCLAVGHCTCVDSCKLAAADIWPV